VAEIFEEASAEAEAPVERAAAAIAVALDEKRARGRRTDTVDAFLEDQRRLTAAQLTHLHAQFGSLRWRAWLGRRDEARAQLAAAASLDLTAAERAELAGVRA
jgi:hypothetical protein